MKFTGFRNHLSKINLVDGALSPWVRANPRALDQASLFGADENSFPRGRVTVTNLGFPSLRRRTNVRLGSINDLRHEPLRETSNKGPKQELSQVGPSSRIRLRKITPEIVRRRNRLRESWACEAREDRALDNAAQKPNVEDSRKYSTVDWNKQNLKPGLREEFKFFIPELL